MIIRFLFVGVFGFGSVFQHCLFVIVVIPYLS